MQTRGVLKARSGMLPLRGVRVLKLAVGVSCLVLLLTSCGSNGDPQAASGGNSGTARSSTPTSETPTSGTTAPSASLAAPAGYTKQQLIFDDQFSGTELDASKWNSYVGAQGERWDDHGSLLFPTRDPTHRSRTRRPCSVRHKSASTTA